MRPTAWPLCLVKLLLSYSSMVQFVHYNPRTGEFTGRDCQPTPCINPLFEDELVMGLTELIENAPWREAVTYRHTWPHEYVLSGKDGQQELLDSVVGRFRAGEGVACRFFRMENTYLFIGEYKYWLMSHWDDLKPDGDYALNRARLYRDRRDFVIQPGDTGMPEHYPTVPAREQPEH